MLAKVITCAVVGLEGELVQAEVDIASGGMPQFLVVGLPDDAVKEARERVRTAIKNSGGKFPSNRITVNLAPADLKKEGPSYDLAIAIGIDIQITGAVAVRDDVDEAGQHLGHGVVTFDHIGSKYSIENTSENRDPNPGSGVRQTRRASAIPTRGNMAAARSG